MLIYNFGDWTEWLEPQKVTFLPEDKLIKIHPGETQIDVQIDLYSAWKEWIRYYDNAKWVAAFTTFGGDPTGESQYAPRYFFLTNGWKVLAEDMAVVVQMNLYSDDGLSPFVINNAAVTNRASDVPIIKSEVEKRLDYGDRIYYDENSIYTGTDYPNGTIAQPVNNIPDAIALANLYNIKTFYCLSDVNILDTGNIFENYSIIADRENLTLTIVDGNYLNNMEWNGFIIDANFGGGENKLIDCVIINALDVSGQMKECQMNGTVRVWNSLVTSMCYSGIAGSSTPIWDMHQYRTTSLSIRSYSGGVDLRWCNFTGDTSTVELIAGQIKINENCTSGYLDLRGVGYLTNNSGTGCTVKTTGFIDSFENYIEESRSTDELLAYQNEIYYDPIDGITGITYPAGTSAKPSNNIPSAYYLSITTNIRNIIIRKEIIVSGLTSLYPGLVLQNYNFIADTYGVNMLIYDPGIVVNSSAKGFNLLKHDLAGYPNEFVECTIDDFKNTAGYFKSCYLFGHIPGKEITVLNNTTFTDCRPGYANVTPIIQLVNTGGTNCNFTNWNGNLKIDKVENINDNITIDVVAGKITLSSGCTSGIIDIRGVGYLDNNAGTGCTVITTGFIDSFENYIEESRATDERLAYADKIYYDQTSIYTGTTYPVGTIAQPVNNLTDAILLANNYNINEFHSLSNIIIDTTGQTFSGYTFVADKENLEAITTGNTFTLTDWHKFKIDMDFNQGHQNSLIDCIVINALNFNGNISSSQFGTPDRQCTISIHENLITSDCFSGNVGGYISKTPIFDLIVGVESRLAVRNYSGGVNILNCDTSGSQATIDLTGQAKFDSSCTAGFIDLRGVGYYINNAGTGCTVKTDGFVNSFGTYIDETRSLDEQLAYQGKIYLDGLNGYTGTTYPIGTIANPVNNLNDLLVLSANLNIKDLYIIGSFISQDISGNTTGVPVDFIGYNNFAVNIDSQLTVNSDEPGIIDNSQLNGFYVKDSDYKGRLITMENCNIENFYNLYGTILNSSISGIISIKGDAAIVSSYSGKEDNPPTIRMVGDGSGETLSVRGYSGNIVIDYLSDDDDFISLDINSGKVIINSGCTAGTIDIRGVGYLVNNAGTGCTVITTGFVDSIEIYLEEASIINEQLAYGGKIYVDQISGSTGTTYPSGTIIEPVKDPFYLSSKLGIEEFWVVSDFIYTPTVYTKDIVMTASHPNINLTIQNGQYIDKSKFVGFYILDAQFTGNFNTYEKCIVLNTTNFHGHIYDSEIWGNLSVHTHLDLWRCWADHYANISTTTVHTEIGATGWYGDMIITNNNVDDEILLNIGSGKITLESGCTNGIIDLRGVGYLVDNSSGATVITTGFVSQTLTSEDVAKLTGITSAIDDMTIAIESLDEKVSYISGVTYEMNENVLIMTSGMTEMGIAISGMTDSVNEMSIQVAGLDEQVKRILGLSQENFRIMDHVYVGDNLSTATVKIYNNSVDCTNDVSPLSTYSMIALYDAGGKLIDYKVTKN
jgi:hypothetical protein